MINRKIQQCKRLPTSIARRGCLRKLYNEVKDGMVAYAMAEEYEGQGRFAEALKYYQEAKERFPLPKYKLNAENSIIRVRMKGQMHRRTVAPSPAATSINAMGTRATHRREGERIDNWVATVILQSSGQYSNDSRHEAMFQTVDFVSDRTQGNGVVLFPGGWLSANEEEPRELYKWAEKSVSQFLSRYRRKITVSLGIDGRFSRDQLVVSYSKAGIEAIGRKFYPAPREKGFVELASNHLIEEDGRSRIFELNGRKYFLCACYDSFGIRKERIQNPGIDVILDHVHGFYPPGKGMSGNVYFAKHGFAGASKQWRCLVFGAAVFYKRKIPRRWPSCVYWNQGAKSTQRWRYTDNPINPRIEFGATTKEGMALVRIYDL